MQKFEFFKSLGFTDYESKTINSLINLKSATPKQIHEQSGVPQNKLYSILKKFEKLGIISQLPTEPKKYKLINLRTFINNKIKQKENTLKQLKKDSKNLQDLKELDEKFLFSLIKGQQAIMNKLAENNIKVKKEILSVQRNWKVWGEGLRQMQTAVNNGVDVKIIGVINDETKKRAGEWKKLGCKIKAYNRKFGEFPLRFAIFDNKEARITIGKPEIPDPKDYLTIWTTSKPLIAILRKQFLEMWKKSDSF